MYPQRRAETMAQRPRRRKGHIGKLRPEIGNPMNAEARPRLAEHHQQVLNDRSDD